MALLSDGGLYGAPDFSPYTIAKNLVRTHEKYKYRFDEIWALVHMMQLYKVITVDEILDDDQDKVNFVMSVSL